MLIPTTIIALGMTMLYRQQLKLIESIQFSLSNSGLSSYNTSRYDSLQLHQQLTQHVEHVSSDAEVGTDSVDRDRDPINRFIGFSSDLTFRKCSNCRDTTRATVDTTPTYWIPVPVVRRASSKYTILADSSTHSMLLDIKQRLNARKSVDDISGRHASSASASTPSSTSPSSTSPSSTSPSSTVPHSSKASESNASNVTFPEPLTFIVERVDDMDTSAIAIDTGSIASEVTDTDSIPLQAVRVMETFNSVILHPDGDVMFMPDSRANLTSATHGSASMNPPVTRSGDVTETGQIIVSLHPIDETVGSVEVNGFLAMDRPPTSHAPTPAPLSEVEADAVDVAEDIADSEVVVEAVEDITDSLTDSEVEDITDSLTDSEVEVDVPVYMQPQVEVMDAAVDVATVAGFVVGDVVDELVEETVGTVEEVEKEAFSVTDLISHETGSVVEEAVVTVEDTGSAVEEAVVTVEDTGSAVEEAVVTVEDTGSVVQEVYGGTGPGAAEERAIVDEVAHVNRCEDEEDDTADQIVGYKEASTVAFLSVVKDSAEEEVYVLGSSSNDPVYVPANNAASSKVFEVIQIVEAMWTQHVHGSAISWEQINGSMYPIMLAFICGSLFSLLSLHLIGYWRTGEVLSKGSAALSAVDQTEMTAVALMSAGEMSAAAQFIERQLPTLVSSLGMEHSDVAAIKHLYAKTQIALGHFEFAEALLEHVMEVYEPFPEDEITQRVLADLSEVQRRLGKSEVAATNLLRSERIALSRSDPDIVMEAYRSQLLLQAEQAAGKATQMQEASDETTMPGLSLGEGDADYLDVDMVEAVCGRLERALELPIRTAVDLTAPRMLESDSSKHDLEKHAVGETAFVAEETLCDIGVSTTTPSRPLKSPAKSPRGSVARFIGRSGGGGIGGGSRFGNRDGDASDLPAYVSISMGRRGGMSSMYDDETDASPDTVALKESPADVAYLQANGGRYETLPVHNLSQLDSEV